MGGGFSTGLFHMEDCELCLSSLGTYPFQEAKIAAHIDGKRPKFGWMDVLPICCFPWCCAMLNRSKLREQYNIPGVIWQDCLLAFFCASCTQAQEVREIIQREKVPIRIWMDTVPAHYN